jgi:hypothetical protein
MKRATKEWFDFAEKDLEVARLLVDNEYVSNAVLFHCQQERIGDVHHFIILWVQCCIVAVVPNGRPSSLHCSPQVV